MYIYFYNNILQILNLHMRSNENRNVDEFQQRKTSHLTKKITEVLCPQGNKAILICFSKDCRAPAFTCTEQKCSCQKIHQKCSMKKLSIIIAKLQQKLLNFQPLIDQSERLISQKISQFQKKINDLVLQNKKLHQSLIQSNDLLGLSLSEKHIYNLMVQKRTDQIKGNQMYISQKDIFGDFKVYFQQKLKQITKYWQQPCQNEKKLSNMMNQFKYKLQQTAIPLFNKDSSILTTFQQKAYLSAVFQDKIQKLELLYKYKYNQNTFYLQNIKQKFKNIQNTLILIKTDLKRIGCFTFSERNTYHQNLLISFTNYYKLKVAKDIPSKNQKDQSESLNQYNLSYQQISFSNSFGRLVIQSDDVFCDINVFRDQNFFGKKFTSIIECQVQVWKIIFKK